MELRDYQRMLADKGLPILKKYGIVYYAVEMRVGKTFTALTVAHEYGAKNVLIITKPSALKDLARDVNRFKKSVAPDMRFTVANYERLACISWAMENLPVSNTYDLIIVDESHSLGAFPLPSAQTKNMKRLVGDLPLIYLSGTPTPESWSQIFHQLWISEHSPFNMYKTFYAWSKVYVDVKQKKIHGIPLNDYSRADQKKIEEKTAHLFVSFSQAEAGFEGGVMESIEYVEVDKRIPALITSFLEDKMYTLKSGDVLLGDTGAKLKSKVHQLCSGTVITEDNKYLVLDASKARYIQDKYSDKKVVVFYVYKAEGLALRMVLRNIVDDRDEFDASKNPCFHIKQVVSGARGVDYSSADLLIYYNIMFSSEIYQQSRARTQTKDKKKDSPVVWLFSKMPEGIEDKIYKVVQKKQDYSAYYFKRDYKVRS